MARERQRRNAPRDTTTRKLSETEKIKLKASYFNGLSIGLMIAGFLIPYLAIAENLGSFIEKLTSEHTWTFAEKANPIGTVLALILAFTGSRTLRRKANDTLAELDSGEEKAG